jgi:hypothetical protein
MGETEARSTLLKSRFFLERARGVEDEDRQAFERFIEASIVFGRSVTFHLQKELSAHAGFADWYSTKRKQMSDDPIFGFFRDKRNYILKEGSIPVLQALSISVSDSVSLSGTVDAKVIRGKPWYRRMPLTWFQDTRATIIRTRNRFTRWVSRSIPRKRPRKSTQVSTSRRLHFQESQWAELPATDVLSQYLHKLETIVEEAEKRFQ